MHRPPSGKCPSSGRVTARLLLSFLALSFPVASSDSLRQQTEALPPILLPSPSQPESNIPANNEHIFSLRHIFHHGTYQHPTLHKKLDVSKSDSTVWMESEDGLLQEVTTPLVVRSRPTTIHRLKDRRPSVVDPMVAAAREHGEFWTVSPSAWTMDSLSGPNVTDKETILAIAKMTANAYVEKPETGNWKDVNGGFNRTDDFGFGWDGDGLRGYIYADETNSTIVIGVKGTSLALYDGDGTTTNDKENDNLFFSCCCGQQSSMLYRTVCDCASGTYTCNLTCLKASLRAENRYYAAARYLYSNVTALYPNSQVWMAGHSLGGSVSALVGLTYGIPVITFESVPDALPAGRLGLPAPPGTDPAAPQQREFTGAYHFGHTADPIYLGTCNGATASCSWVGYALESACHTGMECVYDVVGDLGWRVNVRTHRIITVIESVIEMYDTVPECKFTPECYDCPLWKEYEGNHTLPGRPSSTSTKTRTRTSTCQTPGWWGCLDETTTTSGATITSSTTTTTTTTSSTSSCKTPGWFGCNDETTTSKSTTTSASYATATKTSVTTSSLTTCQSPGYFYGCNDPTASSPPPSAPTSTPTSTDCKTPGKFWGCRDEPTSQSRAHSITSPPAMPSSTLAGSINTGRSCTSSAGFGLICVDPSPTATETTRPTNSPHSRSRCRRRSWLGFCKEWEATNDEWKEEI